ncbi:hypothetical protein CCAND93_180025 [Capnocytophaga canis]|uniref:Uncharacterized protein n=1 Tax=Capnocytophaga canis TaxID=1848903 RepID=A0A0B7IIN1_9FLAO|nr:hypothetical protein CCAND93_180025 [Capnocytophaga canis]
MEYSLSVLKIYLYSQRVLKLLFITIFTFTLFKTRSKDFGFIKKLLKNHVDIGQRILRTTQKIFFLFTVYKYTEMDIYLSSGKDIVSQFKFIIGII